jgi:long-chain acyl-CoA synthetase
MSSLRHIMRPRLSGRRQARDDRMVGPIIYEFYGSTESGTVTFATSSALNKPGVSGMPRGRNCLHRRRQQELPQGRSAKSIRAYQAILISPMQQTGKTHRDRSQGFSLKGDVGYIDTRTAMSSSRPQSATW